MVSAATPTSRTRRSLSSGAVHANPLASLRTMRPGCYCDANTAGAPIVRAHRWRGGREKFSDAHGGGAAASDNSPSMLARYSALAKRGVVLDLTAARASGSLPLQGRTSTYRAVAETRRQFGIRLSAPVTALSNAAVAHLGLACGPKMWQDAALV